jgi:DNA gyrase subunit A
MKLDDGDRIVQVAIARPDDDVLLTTADGQCIRFLIKDEVRLFKGRDSDGVRGIRLDKGDEVISMAILDHFEASAEERAAYLKQASALRRSEDVEDIETVSDVDGEDVSADAVTLTPERFGEMQGAEQFVLTVSTKGFGKRSSSFEFRTSGRGGKGIVAMVANDRNGRLVASFPIAENDQIMLVTDGGQLIRCPVHDIRIAGRNTQGVRIFKTEAEEKVVSVERITEDADEEREAVSS